MLDLWLRIHLFFWNLIVTDAQASPVGFFVVSLKLFGIGFLTFMVIYKCIL